MPLGQQISGSQGWLNSQCGISTVRWGAALSKQIGLSPSGQSIACGDVGAKPVQTALRPGHGNAANLVDWRRLVAAQQAFPAPRAFKS
jgi:hypothetical protein